MIESWDKMPQPMIVSGGAVGLAGEGGTELATVGGAGVGVVGAIVGVGDATVTGELHPASSAPNMMSRAGVVTRIMLGDLTPMA